jgi:DNA-binding NtrC family response regulator
MSEIKRRVLIVDDDGEVRAGLEALLSDDWAVHLAATAREAIVAFGEFSPDVVLLDVQLPDGSGLDLLSQFKMYSETTAIVMMSGAGTLDRVIESMKLGAETFLQKPFDYDTLSITLEQACRILARQKEVIAYRRSERSDAQRIPGASPAIQHLNSLLPNIARAGSPVLIEGESGTGKGILARLIHNSSQRARSAFVDLNCAGLSKELLESELFGHERGAFTNAMNTKPGLFEIAGDGTLFLDEIGEMDPTVQGRVLKSLEEKRFRRVGGIRDLKADFRLIVATNRDLPAEVAAGRFRNDLYYRLNVVRLKMPPLRDRMEDLPILVEEILRPLAKEMGKLVPKVSPVAIKKLMAYAWPGNIRELRNVLERAMITMTGEIRSEDVALDSSVLTASTGVLPTKEWEIEPLDALITKYVAAAVQATKGNVRKAARKLEISPSTLYARLKVADKASPAKS